MRIETSIEALQIAVLEELHSAHRADFEPFGGGFCYVTLDRICGQRIPKEIGRAMARHCRNEGLAEYGRGLFTEDGEVFGSGYCITPRGVEWLAARRPERELPEPGPATFRRLNFERIEPGDEAFVGGKWRPAACVGMRCPPVPFLAHSIYRRKREEGVSA